MGEFVFCSRGLLYWRFVCRFSGRVCFYLVFGSVVGGVVGERVLMVGGIRVN